MLRLRIDRDMLRDAAKACASLAPAKGVHAVYSSLFLRAMPGQPVQMSATDLTTGVVLNVNATVEESGLAVLPAAALAMLCAKLPAGEVLVVVDPATREAKLTAKRGTFMLSGQNPADFPEIPEDKSTAVVDVGAADLRALIRRTMYAASREQAKRFSLTGVLLKRDGTTLYSVATDGRQLALASVVVRDGDPWDVIVPISGLKQFDRLAAEIDGQLGAIVKLSTSRNHAFARTEAGSVVSRIVEGSFPNYGDVVPKTAKTKATCDRQELREVLARASLVGTADESKAFQSIGRLEFHSEGLRVTAQSPERSTDETLDCDVGGPAVKLGCNLEFLMDALDALDEDKVTIEMNDKSNPLKIVEGDHVHVVMPVTLD